MNTIVSFKLAKLLKEKEFDEPVRQRYFIAENIDSDRFPFLQKECALHNWNDYDDSSTTYYSAPTIAEVVMWLYDNHKIWIVVFLTEQDWTFDIFKGLDCVKSESFFNTPVNGYESAIEHTLNNLI